MKIKTLFLFCALLCTLSSCGGEGGAGQELRHIETALDLDLSGGTLERYEDSHGGFHGDGLTAAEVNVDGLAEELEDAPGWSSLPLPDSAAQALHLCGAEEEMVEEGFYYLYDRHSESEDPYDSTQMHSRFSYNFTMAVYDSGDGRLYFYELDT